MAPVRFVIVTASNDGTYLHSNCGRSTVLVGVQPIRLINDDKMRVKESKSVDSTLGNALPIPIAMVMVR
jgi:hypothetical protein